jgi:hypothetical protein
MSLIHTNFSGIRTFSWAVGSVAAIPIPGPFLSGFLAGSMCFMFMHEVSKTSEVFLGNFIRARTWKHISAGALISGLGWGFGFLVAKTDPRLNILRMAMGTGLGLVAYSLGGKRPKEKQD